VFKSFGLHEYLAVIAKAATFKKGMLSVLDNTTAALWATVLRVVSEALKEASEAAVSTQRILFSHGSMLGMSWCVQWSCPRLPAS